MPPVLRLAVAQIEISGEIPTADLLAEAGLRVQEAMREAADMGARVVAFPEGTLTYPHKRKISSLAPELGEADWTRVDWHALRTELDLIRGLAGELGLCTVVGAPHWLRDGARPHNSLYVFDGNGIVTRYDKRRLSMTEVTYLFTPGTQAVSFEVDGFRIGLVVCLEALFPDLFEHYADVGCDAVLIASAGGGIFGDLARSYAAINGCSVALAIPPAPEDPSVSGICGPGGWITRAGDRERQVVVGDVPKRPTEPTFHYSARHGLYDAHAAAHEPRSIDRTSL